MIISKTPLRMSYVGGGSDMSSFYKESEGAVISSSINKYVYVVIKNRFEEGVRLSYSETENVNSIQEIEHPLVRNALEMLDIRNNIEIVSMADIPSSGTGLGSSSSFSVGLIRALLAYKGKSVSNSDLAEMACKLEIDLCKSPIGKQDQYAAAFGDLRVYRFHSDDSVTEEPVIINPKVRKDLSQQTVAFYIGGARKANVILKQQSQELSNQNKFNCMQKMVDLVWVLKSELESGSIENFGKILHENWELKRSLSEGITNSYVDDLYNEAISAGAIGGKLLGAGGGGFMIFHVPSSEIKMKVKKRFNNLREVNLGLVQSGSGIIFSQEASL